MSPKERFQYLEGKDHGLAIDKESGIYYAIKYFPGMPPLFKSLRTNNRREAKQKLNDKIQEHLDRYGSHKKIFGQSPTVGEVIDEIERVESPRLREKTRKKRTFYFKRIRHEMDLGHVRMDQMNLKVWTIKLDRVRAKRKRKTFWDYSKHMNIIQHFAYQQKYVSHLISYPNPDGHREEGTVFTIDEIHQLWNALGEETRDQFVLGYECAMRLREALHLSWDRVDLETGEITLRPQDVKTGSKTGKGRKFIVTPHALERLRRRKAEQNPPSKWVFPSPTGRGPVDDNKIAWNRAKRDVLEGNPRRGIKPNPAFQHWGTWHDLRHSAISRMLVEQKMNITLVSEYVGTSVATLQKVYLHSKAEHTRGVNTALMIQGSPKTTS